MTGEKGTQFWWELRIWNLVLQPVKLGPSPCCSSQRASPCPIGCSPHLDPGVGVRDQVWKGFLFQSQMVSICCELHGLSAFGLDLRERYSVFWFKSEEGLMLHFSIPY